MPVNPVAENVLGTIGAICWTGQLLPQVWKSWRTKDTEGLSHWLMFIWACAAAVLGIFVVVQKLNIPLILQPQLFGFLSSVSWGQCMYYGHKKSLVRSLALFIVFITLLGSFEAGMIFAVRPAYRHGNQTPVRFFGIMSSVLLSAGLLPQYVEIWRLREVKGISLMFMFIDLMGGVFSDLSLAFRPEFDVIAGVAYTLVVVLDGIVLIAAIILNPRARRRRERAAELEASGASPALATGVVVQDADVPLETQPPHPQHPQLPDVDDVKRSSSPTLCVPTQISGKDTG
ncbi:hypothetical protein BD410DRAFT_786774 [Rickenella mellea]|uniref:PQ-loop-domain-containing protein n=1 Tax=Rickenella mellea TaxID=50990 RepID=A0A4Y7QB49_9AGAM|nr:hypothetical protein BD410DRAFT_786774 [Rickenella mellea]